MGSHRVGYNWNDSVAAAAENIEQSSNSESFLKDFLGGLPIRNEVTSRGKAGSLAWPYKRWDVSDGNRNMDMTEGTLSITLETSGSYATMKNVFPEKELAFHNPNDTSADLQPFQTAETSYSYLSPLLLLQLGAYSKVWGRRSRQSNYAFLFLWLLNS